VINDIYFKILGITRFSTKKEIKKAYREQIKQWHPDKFSNDEKVIKEATKRTQILNEAFSILKDYTPPIDNNKKGQSVSFDTTINKTKHDSAQNISRIRVVSSTVYSIGYDNQTKTLQVEFKNRSIYEYYDVPSNIYEAFMRAESKGRFIPNLYKYKYHRV
jgi:DnaJ-class molecular chaperone